MCGDFSSWERDSACTAHQSPTGHAEIANLQDARERLPEDVAERLSAVARSALGYAYQMLTLRDSPQSSPELLSGTLTLEQLAFGGDDGGVDDALEYVAVEYYHESEFEGEVSRFSIITRLIVQQIIIKQIKSVRTVIDLERCVAAQKNVQKRMPPRVSVTVSWLVLARCNSEL